jgi:hypothetical protein
MGIIFLVFGGAGSEFNTYFEIQDKKNIISINNYLIILYYNNNKCVFIELFY